MHHLIFFKNKLWFIISMSLFFACSSNDETAETQPEDSDCLPEQMVERMSIKTAEMGRLTRSLTLPGNIEVNKDRVYDVLPAAGGVISEVHVRTGDHVNRGQALATVQSPEIIEFKRDLNAAKAEKEIAAQNLEVTKSMVESGVSSRRELIEAEKELSRASAEIERLKKKQAVLGVQEGQTTYTIRAPESGFIVERKINPGTTLRADDGHVFRISDLRDVWVVANVSESDIGSVRIGDTVAIHTLAYSDKIFTGEIVRLSNTIDPNKRTMEAVIELPNPDILLKPGMFANIKLHAKDEGSYVFIPSTALIFDENLYYVVVYRDRCDSEIRPVTVRRKNGHLTYLSEGVDAGEKIIINRHILVYNKLTSGN